MRAKNKEQKHKKRAIISLCSLFFVLCSRIIFAQTVDTIQLRETSVTAYFNERPLLSSPSSASVIDSTKLSVQAKQSFVPIFNSVPGVRMEERSPGSYRLSIRGSLLRSPFGVRNVKIYADEFPLTDAGGNTYLNLIDPTVVKRIEVLKGPDGSLFGANSGGVVRLGMIAPIYDSSKTSIGFTTGSYGLFHEHASVQKHFNDGIFSISGAWKYSDGYRDHSSSDHQFLHTAGRWNYTPFSQLRWIMLYSDLRYETPGGLTLQQMQDDPQASRPATAILPGASEQDAGVHNRTVYGGISNDISLGAGHKYVFALFGSHTDFKNPFITNYETRNENSAGIRTWFELNDLFNFIHWNVGVEAQRTASLIKNYDNVSGTKDSLRNDDLLNASQHVVFTRLVFDWSRWILETSLSVNFNQYKFSSVFPVMVPEYENQFDPQLMPRVAASYRLTDRHFLRASISKGYSPPTLAEIRSSDNTINTTLQPEQGWNYETGFRMKDRKNNIHWDLSLFYYRLQNAIVRRTNEEGEEFFVNAGGTAQPGIESEYGMALIRNNDGLFRGLDLNNSYSLSLFRFKNYSDELSDYSGNAITGVPQHVMITGLSTLFPYRLYLNIQHYFSSEIPLNDLNDEHASAYHLIQLKAGWKYSTSNNLTVELCAGTDNLLNERYSLGHDLNAAGRRYYNSAPVSNYFVSASLLF